MGGGTGAAAGPLRCGPFDPTSRRGRTPEAEDGARLAARERGPANTGDWYDEKLDASPRANGARGRWSARGPGPAARGGRSAIGGLTGGMSDSLRCARGPGVARLLPRLVGAFGPLRAGAGHDDGR